MPQKVYLAVTGAGGGTGSQTNPYDCANGRIDSILSGFFESHTGDVRFLMAPGEYLTRGVPGIFGQGGNVRWKMLSGWEFISQTPRSAKLKLSGFDAIDPREDRNGQTHVMYIETWENHGIRINGLVVDASYPDFCTRVLPFIQPATGATLEVPVRDVGVLQSMIGSSMYCFDRRTHERVGYYMLDDTIPGRSMAVLTRQDDVGTGYAEGQVVASNAKLGPNGRDFLLGPNHHFECIFAGSHDCIIENCRATNFGGIAYELIGGGITIAAINSGWGSGNVIRGCRVDNFFGQHAMGIGAISNNNDTGDQGATTNVSASITDNVVVGNGYNVMLGGFGLRDVDFRRNEVSNGWRGFFVDSSYNRDLTFRQNRYNNCQYALQFGGGHPGFHDISIRNEQIAYGPLSLGEVWLNGNLDGFDYVNNQVFVSPGMTPEQRFAVPNATGNLNHTRSPNTYLERGPTIPKVT